MQNDFCSSAGRWLLLALLLVGPARTWAQAPTFTQAVSFNPTAGTGSPSRNAIAVDAAGNQYVTGSFTGTLVLGTTTLTSAGLDDIFVAKRSASTGAWLWAVRAGGSDDDYSSAVAVDAAGNALVTGGFNGTARFATSPTATALTSASGKGDVFVAKFRASDGAAVWAVQAEGSETNFGTELAVDAAGNALVMGEFFGTTRFATSPTATTLTPIGNGHLFVAKFGASDGAAVWAVGAGEAGVGSSDYAAGYGLAADVAGNALITGFFTGTVHFATSPTATALSSAGSGDVFVAKLRASDGAAVWAVRAGGSSYELGSGVAVDAAGNALVTGFFYNTASFATSPTATTLTSAGNRDVFVAKFGASDGAAAWAVRAGGSGNDDSTRVAVDAAGNALVTGHFYGTASFATSPTATTLTSAGDRDVFVAKFGASNGAAAWAVRAGGSGNDESTGVAVDAAGNVSVTGSFAGTASFGSQTLMGAGSNSLTGFVAMLGGAGTLATTAELAAAPATLFPNPAHGTAYLTGTTPHAPLTLLDALGRTVLTATADASGAATLDVGDLPAGLYVLREAGGATRRLAVE